MGSVALVQSAVLNFGSGHDQARIKLPSVTPGNLVAVFARFSTNLINSPGITSSFFCGGGNAAAHTQWGDSSDGSDTRYADCYVFGGSGSGAPVVGVPPLGTSFAEDLFFNIKLAGNSGFSMILLAAEFGPAGGASGVSFSNGGTPVTGGVGVLSGPSCPITSVGDMAVNMVWERSDSLSTGNAGSGWTPIMASGSPGSSGMLQYKNATSASNITPAYGNPTADVWVSQSLGITWY